MRADLSTDDFDGLIQAHREQVQLRRLEPSEAWQPCTPADDAFITIGFYLLCIAPVLAFLYFLLF